MYSESYCTFVILLGWQTNHKLQDVSRLVKKNADGTRSDSAVYFVKCLEHDVIAWSLYSLNEWKVEVLVTLSV